MSVHGEQEPNFEHRPERLAPTLSALRGSAISRNSRPHLSVEKGTWVDLERRLASCHDDEQKASERDPTSVVNPLNLADHEAADGPTDISQPLTNKEKPNRQCGDANRRRKCFHGPWELPLWRGNALDFRVN